MQEFAKRKPHQLSGGQRRCACYFGAQPGKTSKLLLLDEPMGALDKPETACNWR